MLQRFLAAQGSNVTNHSVVSLLRDGAIAEQIRSLGVSLTSLELKRGRITLKSINRLRSIIREQAPDIVQGWMYHGCMAAWGGRLGSGRTGPGLVWAIHHSLQNIRNEKRSSQLLVRALALLSGKADLITYCSQNSRSQHEKVGFSADRTLLIPNAIDTKMFRPDPEARGRLESLCEIDDNRILIGNFARSHPMKDHVSMVRATANLLKRGYDVHSVIIGDGIPSSPAMNEARSLGIADRVSAFEARNDVAKLVPGLDIFFLSSAWGEAFPLSVGEAMAAEIPCVVTDVGDCAYLVGDSGIVVACGEPEQQANAIAALLDAGPEQQEELGRKARERITKNFSSERYINLHESAYSQVISTRAIENKKGPLSA
ncbi:MAG: glycosyltransferase [Rhodobacteraceae bacterium]|nr:glycosyltransferase [Paracoccaceae bacterium]